MSEPGMTMDNQLVRAPDALEQTEKRLRETERELSRLKAAHHEMERTFMESNSSRLKELEGKVVKLEETIKELMHVNRQWDLEYREQEEAFRRYRFDSQQSQTENQDHIARVKAEKEQLLEEIKSLKYERDMRRRRDDGRGGSSGAGAVQSLQRKVAEQQEEMVFLRQQLKTFQEDFEAERRDRERLNEEKESASLRYEAEITSLKLQLDRCRNELTHYTTEASRLSQQLRLKAQFEEDQFKKHLEAKGFVPRGTNSPLPPLDPYVEHDKNGYNLMNHSDRPLAYQVPAHEMNGYDSTLQQLQWRSRSRQSSSVRASPIPRRDHLLPVNMISRGVESISAPTSLQRQSSPSPPMVRNDSPLSNPSTGEVVRNKAPARFEGGGGVVLVNGHLVDPSLPAPRPRSDIPNGHVDPPPLPVPARTIQYPPSISPSAHNTPLTPYSQHLPSNNQDLTGMLARFNTSDPTSANPDVSHIPPMESKGKYSCPRCARRFNKKTDCDDHKIRCLS